MPPATTTSCGRPESSFRQFLTLGNNEVVLYQEWIENNRELERTVTEMRDISSRVLALITGREVP